VATKIDPVKTKIDPVKTMSEMIASSHRFLYSRIFRATSTIRNTSKRHIDRGAQ
jgi:hypothetical protein